jgi:uncharacterized protein
MWRDLKIPFFTVLFIFVGFFLFTKIFGPLPFSVTSTTTTKANLFTVQGKGEVTAIPDTALVTLGVNKQATNVDVAKQQVDQIINKITQDVKALGIDAKNIKTSNYSINPDYDYTTGTQVPRGYTVNASIEIKVTPLEKANNAVDIATKDGATQVGGIQFVLDDQKQKELEDQARQAAIDNAKEKAESLSKSAGIHLGRVVDVQENTPGDIVKPILNMSAKTADATQETTQLNPGENKVTSTVSLSYETF